MTPSLTTVAREDVILGNPVTDDATLGGTAYQPGTNGPDATYTSINADMVTPANGTITFTLFGPGDCTTVAANPNSPTTNPQDVTVIGDGVYTASFTPAAIGEYTWVANYSGDSPNTDPFGPTACPDTNEAVIVIGESELATAQDWVPNDTATLTGDTNLNGTLTFTLYASADCTGTPVPDQSYTVPVVNAVSGSTFSTSNTTFKVTAANQGSYSWLVHYDDTNLTDPPGSVRDVDGDDHRLSQTRQRAS